MSKIGQNPSFILVGGWYHARRKQMGPGVAIPRLLERNQLTIEDIEIVEMHKAFGGQVLANLRAL